MIDPATFLNVCKRHGVDFFTGVPDSLLKQLGQQIAATVPRRYHVIAANEGAAVGIAIGHYLRTGQPAGVYLQNSGLGNLVNPLVSLADPDVYGVPMLLVVGWRGRPGTPDEPQHVKQGRITAALLDARALPWSTLPRDDAGAELAVRTAIATAVEHSGPYVLLVEPGTFGPPSAAFPPVPPLGPTAREAALVALVDAVGPGAVLVATTGMLSRELFAHRAAGGGDGRLDFLVVGGMGHASSIALGIALREPHRQVWCLDGDGALLMHLGSLAVIADLAPRNYFHVVFNNGVHDSVGGQPTSIGRVDIGATARGLGYRLAVAVAEPAAVPAAVSALRHEGGPSMLELRVRPGSRPDLGRPTVSPARMKQVFMAACTEPLPPVPNQQHH